MFQKGFAKTPNKKPCFCTGRVWLLVIAAVIIAAGVLVWWQLQTPAEAPTGGEQVPTEETQSPADETADWKTYKDDKHAFEIKYPKDWNLFDRTAPDEVRFYHPLHGLDMDTFEQVVVTLKVKRPEGLMFKEKSGEEIARFLVEHEEDVQDIIFQGRKAYKAMFDYSLVSDSYYGESMAFPDPKNILGLEFSLDTPNRYKNESLEIFNQMLSTFRFLE